MAIFNMLLESQNRTRHFAQLRLERPSGRYPTIDETIGDLNFFQVILLQICYPKYDHEGRNRVPKFCVFRIFGFKNRAIEVEDQKVVSPNTKKLSVRLTTLNIFFVSKQGEGSFGPCATDRAIRRRI
jgi:hypothetical protein